MLPFILNTPYQDRTVLTTLGSVSLTEYISRDGPDFYSSPLITLSGLQSSGIVESVQLQLRNAETCAQNTVTFLQVPNPGDTITLDQQVYRFIPLIAGYQQFGDVHIGNTPEATAIQFYKVVMQVGTPGVDFYSPISTSVVSASGIVNFSLTSGGSNYLGVGSAPAVPARLVQCQTNGATPGTPVNATSTATVSVYQGTIQAVTITSPGISYTGTAINVFIAGGGAGSAYGTATLTSAYSINSVGQPINVVSTTGLPATGYVSINGHNCAYTGLTANTLLGVTAVGVPFIANPGNTVQYGYVGSHPTIDIVYADNYFVLRAWAQGTAGNLLTSTTSDATNIQIIGNTLISGGSGPGDYFLTQQLPAISGLNGNYQFNFVSYDIIGDLYDGYVTLYDINGNSLVTPTGSGISYYVGPVRFYGKSVINEFTEVTTLSGIWDPNNQPSSTGMFYVTWDNPIINISGLTFPIAAPATIGTPTQSTRAFTAIEFAQIFDFLVWVFVPVTDHNPPERNWPRTVDANGTWYYAGRTNNMYANVQVPTTVGLGDLVIKPSAVAATTAALGGSGWSYYNNILTNPDATLTIDGVGIVTGQYILIKNQTDARQNGLYVATHVGTQYYIGNTLTRAPEMTIGNQFINAYVPVTGGTVNAGTTWECVNTFVSVGITSIVFVKYVGFASATAIWVGYGNKFTYATSVLPWNNATNSVYLL